MFYAKSTGGFYRKSVHGDGIPGDAVEISQDEYENLLSMQSSGMLISADENGRPIAVNRALGSDLKPTHCTPAQGLVALFALKSITEENVLASIGQITDPVRQYTARIGYQRATAWERGSRTMQTMAQLLQLSEQDLDELFTYAVTVQV
ncbi:MAG: hypothetical protein AB7U71_16505 [Comamonas sp.]